MDKLVISEEIKSLNDIPFSDAYLGSRDQILRGVPGSVMDPVPVPPWLRPEAETLRRKVMEEFERSFPPDRSQQRGVSEYGLRYVHGAHIYRATRFRSMEDTLLVLRRFPKSVPEFESLGLRPIMAERLMTPRLSGLVLISGAFAQGKTTTASAYVDARLRKFGGVGITIEDPPEMPLEGVRGDGGVCFQTECQRGGFGDAVRMASRISPDIVFLGEIRDGEAAVEAVRAANNGRLIVATIHADQPSSAVERLYAFASGLAGGAEDVAGAVSRGLAAVLHQRLEALSAERLTLVPQMLWLGGPVDPIKDRELAGVYEQARKLIHSRRWNEVDALVNTQMMQMMHSRSR